MGRRRAREVVLHERSCDQSYIAYSVVESVIIPYVCRRTSRVVRCSTPSCRFVSTAEQFVADVLLC